jgi:peptidoglycan/xylan/chitin deacetylase (PgdA/CDA1 family)
MSIAQRALRFAKRVPRRAIMRSWRAHGMVLMYHRVTVSSWDPWSVCVDPDRFEQHLATLVRFADVVPLSELTSELRRGRRERPVAALTFDDGYADTLHVALPLLERYSVPATVFIVTAAIDGEPFWWDRLLAILQSIERLPVEIRLPIAGDEFVWQRRPTDGGHARDRDRLCSAMWSRLVATTDDDRRIALDQLEALVNPGSGGVTTARPMTKTELRSLAASPLIEIGGHTMNHRRLPDLSAEAQLTEIVGSRQQCQDLTSKFPFHFAYPFGAFDELTPELVRAAGFERAFSSEKDLVWDGSDIMLLPRIPVMNYTAREFSARLRMEWLP